MITLSAIYTSHSTSANVPKEFAYILSASSTSSPEQLGALAAQLLAAQRDINEHLTSVMKAEGDQEMAEAGNDEEDEDEEEAEEEGHEEEEGEANGNRNGMNE